MGVISFLNKGKRMAFHKPKVHTGRIVSKKQLLATRENFAIFKLKGLQSQVTQMKFFPDAMRSEEMEKYKENLQKACYHLQAAEIYFKMYQKARIKEGEKK